MSFSIWGGGGVKNLLFFAYVRKGGGVVKSVQVRTGGEGGSKFQVLLRTYFMDGP